MCKEEDCPLLSVAVQGIEENIRKLSGKPGLESTLLIAGIPLVVALLSINLVHQRTQDENININNMYTCTKPRRLETLQYC